MSNTTDPGTEPEAVRLQREVKERARAGILGTPTTPPVTLPKTPRVPAIPAVTPIPAEEAPVSDLPVTHEKVTFSYGSGDDETKLTIPISELCENERDITIILPEDIDFQPPKTAPILIEHKRKRYHVSFKGGVFTLPKYKVRGVSFAKLQQDEVDDED